MKNENRSPSRTRTSRAFKEAMEGTREEDDRAGKESSKRVCGKWEDWSILFKHYVITSITCKFLDAVAQTSSICSENENNQLLYHVVPWIFVFRTNTRSLCYHIQKITRDRRNQVTERVRLFLSGGERIETTKIENKKKWPILHLTYSYCFWSGVACRYTNPLLDLGKLRLLVLRKVFLLDLILDTRSSR